MTGVSHHHNGYLCISAGTARIINQKYDGSNGVMYKIVPMTTNNVTNQITCFKVPGLSESPVLPQGVLPNSSLYKVQCMYSCM